LKKPSACLKEALIMNIYLNGNSSKMPQRLSKSKKPKKDIGELGYLREDLETLRRYLEEFSNFLPLPVIDVNQTGFVLGVNKAFEKLIRLGKTKVLGKPVGECFEEKEKLSKFQQRTLNGEFISGKEMTLLAKNQRIPISIYIAPRKDRKGNIIGYFIGIYDITKFKELQENLEQRVEIRTKEAGKRTEELLGSRKALMNILEDVKEEGVKAEKERDKTLAIITNFSDGLLVFDKGEKLLLANPRLEEFFGIKAKDIEGKSVSELQKNNVLKPLVELFDGKGIKEVFRKELEITRDLILEASIVPIMRGKKKLGTLVILHNITREKLVERMKTEFVSLAAHQLRTPLSAIKWTLKMFLEGDLGKMTKEQKEFLDGTYKSNEKMIVLINDLLNVTRIEEGRYLYGLTLTDVEDLINSIVDSHKGKAKERNLILGFRKPEKKLPKVMLDVEKMNIAITNLLNNAVRYTPSGGKVLISLKQTKKGIEFSIKDTGAGIPENQQKRVFTKFFRGANAIRMETEGTGLGLFIAKNIIEAHKGKIWFESKEGKGTTFYFTIPINPVRGYKGEEKPQSK